MVNVAMVISSLFASASSMASGPSYQSYVKERIRLSDKTDSVKITENTLLRNRHPNSCGPLHLKVTVGDETHSITQIGRGENTCAVRSAMIEKAQESFGHLEYQAQRELRVIAWTDEEDFGKYEECRVWVDFKNTAGFNVQMMGSMPLSFCKDQ